MKKVLITLFSASRLSFAQDAAMPGEIELLLENSTEESDYSGFADELEFYRQNPIPIKSATLEDLSKLPFLTPADAERILHLRDSLGILSRPDLLSLSEIDERKLLFLLQFISFELADRGSSGVSGRTRISLRSRTESDLQIRKAFREGKYRSSRIKHYHRLEAFNPRFVAGILYEKDGGETLENSYVTGSVYGSHVGPFDKIILGNFSVNEGQGLVLSRPGLMGKNGGAAGAVKKFGADLAPHFSTDEFHFFRGVAAKVERPDVTVLAFASDKTQAASLDEEGRVTSVYPSGLFRSEMEIAKKNVLGERVLGAVSLIRFGELHRIGIAAVKAEYDRHIGASPPYSLNGKEFSAIGANADLVFDDINLFGEIAGHSFHSMSGIGGFVYRPEKNFSVASYFRSYSPRYHNPFSSGFSERSGLVNGEDGRYVGIEVRPAHWWKISAYFDEFVTSDSGFGQRGHEYFVRNEIFLTRSLEAILQYRLKAKTDKALNDDLRERSVIQDRLQQTVRCSFSYSLPKNIVLAQRFEYTQVQYTVSRNSEEGMLIFTQVSVRPVTRLTCRSRFVFFDTKSYDSRLYQYESDLAGGYSNPPLYGGGIRWYAIVAYDILERATLSMKYGETLKWGVNTIGSGDAEIQGNVDNHFGLQLDMEL